MADPNPVELEIQEILSEHQLSGNEQELVEWAAAHKGTSWEQAKDGFRAKAAELGQVRQIEDLPQGAKLSKLVKDLTALPESEREAAIGRMLSDGGAELARATARAGIKAKLGEMDAAAEWERRMRTAMKDPDMVARYGGSLGKKLREEWRAEFKDNPPTHGVRIGGSPPPERNTAILARTLARSRGEK